MTERTESSSASASTLTRQTRSAASAYVGEITASTAQTSTARLISNSPFVALLHLTTPHEECPLMGWSARAPAPPASEAGKGHQRQGARHVSDTQYRDRRDRHRYRQELVPRRGPQCARRHRAAAKVVAWP